MTLGQTPGLAGFGGTHGVDHTSSPRALGASAVSRDALHDLADIRDDRGHTAIEEALARAAERASAAYDSQHRWTDRLRAGLGALLEHFDEEPQLARLCVGQDSPAAAPAVLARRDEILAALVRMIDDGRGSARRQPPPRTAEGVLAGTLGAIRARLLEADAGTLADLVNPLMSFIVLPYLGAAAARTELTSVAPRH